MRALKCSKFGRHEMLGMRQAYSLGQAGLKGRRPFWVELVAAAESQRRGPKLSQKWADQQVFIKISCLSRWHFPLRRLKSLCLLSNWVLHTVVFFSLVELMFDGVVEMQLTVSSQLQSPILNNNEASSFHAFIYPIYVALPYVLGIQYLIVSVENAIKRCQNTSLLPEKSSSLSVSCPMPSLISKALALWISRTFSSCSGKALKPFCSSRSTSTHRDQRCACTRNVACFSDSRGSNWMLPAAREAWELVQTEGQQVGDSLGLCPLHNSAQAAIFPGGCYDVGRYSLLDNWPDAWDKQVRIRFSAWCYSHCKQLWHATLYLEECLLRGQTQWLHIHINGKNVALN